jgi:hypothetical protein
MSMTIEAYAKQLATLQNAVGKYALAQSESRCGPDFQGDAHKLGIGGWAWLKLSGDEAAAIERCGFGFDYESAGEVGPQGDATTKPKSHE